MWARSNMKFIWTRSLGEKKPEGVIYKPRGQLRGRVVSQMIILLHKPYLVKVTTKGRGGVKNTQNFDHVVYGWPLSANYTNWHHTEPNGGLNDIYVLMASGSTYDYEWVDAKAVTKEYPICQFYP